MKRLLKGSKHLNQNFKFFLKILFLIFSFLCKFFIGIFFLLYFYVKIFIILNIIFLVLI
jgi:hypothetical protein